MPKRYTPETRTRKAADDLLGIQNLFRYELNNWLMKELDDSSRAIQVADELISEIGFKNPHTVIEEAERIIIKEKHNGKLDTRR